MFAIVCTDVPDDVADVGTDKLVAVRAGLVSQHPESSSWRAATNNNNNNNTCHPPGPWGDATFLYHTLLLLLLLLLLLGVMLIRSSNGNLHWKRKILQAEEGTLRRCYGDG
uniref:Uncharacterized protein n=1 Tax=Anopheles farauti TaxID=69004 RepID=A0A182QVA9_9DIPT